MEEKGLITIFATLFSSFVLIGFWTIFASAVGMIAYSFTPFIPTPVWAFGAFFLSSIFELIGYLKK